MNLFIIFLIIALSISVTINVFFRKPAQQIEGLKNQLKIKDDHIEELDQEIQKRKNAEQEMQEWILGVCKGLRFKKLIGQDKHYDEEWVDYSDVHGSDDTFHSEPFSIGNVEWIVKIYCSHSYRHGYTNSHQGRRCVEVRKCVYIPT